MRIVSNSGKKWNLTSGVFSNRESTMAAYKEADGLLSAKHHKSIPKVTIFLLIAMPWWILCLPWQKNKSCRMLLQRTYTHFGMSTSKIFAASSSFQVCDVAVADSTLLATLFACQTQLNLCKSYDFTPWRKFLSIPSEQLLVFCDRYN